MILANQSVHGTQTGIQVESLAKLADFYRNRLNELSEKLRENGEKIEKNNAHKARLNALLITKGYSNAVGIITSTIIADKDETATIQLKYNIFTVYWSPYYDIKVTALDKPLFISTKAKVIQNSGVNWDNVNLTLSTTLPTVFGVKPNITPWILQFYQQITYKKQYTDRLIKKDEAKDNISFRGSREDGTAYYEDGVRISNSLTAKEFTTIQNNIIAKEFTISIPYTIANKGTAVMELEENTAKSDFYYYAAPKVDKKVYLLADISDWEKLDLIQGEANIYLQGKFMGTTYIDPNSTEDTLSLMIGQDMELQTDRKKVDELCKKSTFGGNKKTEMAMEIIVKNNKNIPVRIILEDQVPISYNEKIEVTVEEVSKAKHDKETGLLTWEFVLEPNKSEKKSIKYVVKHPKNKPINL